MSFKSVWRFKTQSSSLWSSFLKAIYGVHGVLDNFNCISRRSPWLDTLNEMSSLKNKGIDLFALIRKKVGNGEDTFFWLETWLGELDLRHQLESCKHILIAKKIRHASLSSSFRPPPRGGAEDEQFLLLQSRLVDLILPQLHDRWSWSFDASGKFSVNSVRNLVDDMFLPMEDVPTRWVKVIPIKINVFAWRVFLDKLLTLLNLS